MDSHIHYQSCSPTWNNSGMAKNIVLQHTYTRLTAHCPGLPGWANTGKVKPIWILLKQETVSGSGISWAVCKSAPRSRQITMPAPHHSVFLQTGSLLAAQPTASKHWRQCIVVQYCATMWHNICAYNAHRQGRAKRHRQLHLIRKDGVVGLKEHTQKQSLSALESRAEMYAGHRLPSQQTCFCSCYCSGRDRQTPDWCFTIFPYTTVGQCNLRFLLKKANKDILQISRGISFHIDGDVILTFLTALQCAKRTLQI